MGGVSCPEIQKGEEVLAFGREALGEGCGEEEYYEELTREAALDLVRRGHMVSFAFLHWDGGMKGRDKKRRFEQYFHFQSQQWEKKGTRVETKESFASLLR